MPQMCLPLSIIFVEFRFFFQIELQMSLLTQIFQIPEQYTINTFPHKFTKLKTHLEITLNSFNSYYIIHTHIVIQLQNSQHTHAGSAVFTGRPILEDRNPKI